MPYTPSPNSKWENIDASKSEFDAERLRQAIEQADSFESPWPYDLGSGNNVPGLTEIEKPPWNEILGPFKPRGRNNGLVLKSGKVAAQWGEIDRVDMTFSIAKSYLAILAGLAVGDGLISSIDDTVGDTVNSAEFASEQNRSITWRNLLEQTSEWEGTLWDKPDLVDRNRRVEPGSNNDRKGEHRDLQAPGTFWEYNDVRVNALSLALLYTFRRPLSDVLKERIMDPIGASESWAWNGYRNSYIEIDGQQMQSVPGGTHWGGGIQISTLDHARFALLVHRDGMWGDKRLLPEGWCNSLREPSVINSGYGKLWWLNTNHVKWQGCPASSYAAIGAGDHIIWINPDDDMILVARWIDENKLTDLVISFYKALT